MSLTKLSLSWNNLFFPAWESLVSDIPAVGGKSLTVFYSVTLDRPKVDHRIETLEILFLTRRVEILKKLKHVCLQVGSKNFWPESLRRPLVGRRGGQQSYN
jgi:hypothetical protein